MWTFRHPYKPSEISGEYIQRRAKIALSRALNINRLIVFSGSGLSAAYDQMTWNELVNLAADIALGKNDTTSRSHFVPTSATKTAAERTIERLDAHRSEISSANVTMLEVVEELARLSNRQDKFRSQIAKAFGQTHEALGENRSKEIAKENNKLEASLKASAARAVDLTASDLPRCDPIATLINDIGIRRFVTVNYDVEIERCFERVFRVRGAGLANKPKSDFQRLCEGSAGQGGKALPDHIEYRDGTTRSVSSVCLNGGNIGELVSFSMFSSQYVSQVFHLHGRYDKPESLILTEADYQRRYFKTDETRQAFEEAFSNLFTGNDVLFVGLGMSEEELLRPLRHFLSNDHTPDYAKRHVFSLLPRKVTLNKEFFETEPRDELGRVEAALAQEKLNQQRILEIRDKNSARARKSGDISDQRVIRNLIKDSKTQINRLKSRKENLIKKRKQKLKEYRETFNKSHFSISEDIEYSALSHDRACDENQQLELRSKYGVLTINFGGIDYRTILLLCKLIKKVTNENRPAPYEVDKMPYLCAFECLIERLKACISESAKKPAKRRYLLNPKEFAAIEKLAVACRDQFQKQGYVNPAIQTTLNAISSQIYSLALDQELGRVQKRRSKWWQDWRLRPEERRAQYAPVRPLPDSGDTENRRPCYSRHQAEYLDIPKSHYNASLPGEENIKAKTGFAALAHLRELARQEKIIQADKVAEITALKVGESPVGQFSIRETNRGNIAIHENRFGSRILRATMARGSGKGSLFHLLSQEVPTQEIKDVLKPGPQKSSGQNLSGHLYLDTLFEQDRTFRYASSFVLHLSYSMEFSSVISALAHFFEKAVVGALHKHQADIHKVYAGLSPDDTKDEAGPVDDGIARVRDTLSQQKRLIMLVEDFCGLVKEKLQHGTVSEDQCRTFALDFFNNHSPLFGPGRVHRLERMRARMLVYTYLADILPEKNLRLFVGMSGLDKLCNEKGVAYNPMYRALFRILTGCGQKYEHEAELMIPVDFFFLSGTDQPLRYLTEEHSRDEVETNLSRHPPLKGQYASYFDYREVDKNTYLRVWPSLPPISLGERYWTKPKIGTFSELETTLQAPRLDPDETAEGAVENVYDSGRDPSFNRWLGAIRREIDNSVALHAWVEGAWKKARDFEDSPAHAVEDWLRSLDAAASSGGAQMVVEEVMAQHRQVLRNPKLGLNLSEGHASIGRRGKTTIHCDNLLTELLYVVLAQFALFPMPVELRVVYSCPQVKELLERIERKHRTGDAEPPQNKTNDKHVVHGTTDVNTLRSQCLAILQSLMDYMHESSLVIKVKRKPTESPGLNALAPEPIVAGSNACETVLRAQDRAYSRYIIQHQLRDFAAKEMDLSVPDQGEHNYFQVSIYPDQPRDLPTPRQDHYEMVLEIFENQIKTVRNTLWCLFQIEALLRDLSTHPGDERKHTPYAIDRLSDDLVQLLDHGLKRRLQDEPILGDPSRLSHEAPSIQAISQRIRALYGMLRSGFTAGTISRLSQIATVGEPDQPYERFRGWLRGLTNAAVGFDEVQNTLCLLTGTVPQDKEKRDKLERLADRLYTWTETEIVGETPLKDLAHTIRKFFLAPAVPEPGGPNTQDVPHTSTLKAQREGMTLPPKPLYRDEIGWILNERGLLSLLQGHIFDAIPLFNRALNAMYHQGKEAGNDPALHAAVRRVRFNRALALILRGHIQRAKREFQSLILPTDIASHSGSQISWLSQGYIHLCDYYSGDLSSSLSGYLEVIKNAEQRRIMRLASIFNRHAANLLIRQSKFGAALDHVRLAISCAEQSEQRDVLHFANITEARLNISARDPLDDDTSRLLFEARNYGRKMGIPRLEAAAMRTQADLLLLHNDRESAGELSALSAAIANRCGLRLEKLQALPTFAEVLINRGQGTLAKSLLDEIGRDAERHDFQLISGRIRHLRSLL